jgi:ATP-dependent DNA helicase RecG
MEREELQKIVVKRESDTIEFKKPTNAWNRVGETLCAFLNGRGARVFIGIRPEGRIVGQQISDNTQQEVAGMLSRFEPSAPVNIHRIPVSNGHEVMVLEAKPSLERFPFTFEGKPYQRIGSTTSVMPQAQYETLLLERASTHSRLEIRPELL